MYLKRIAFAVVLLIMSLGSVLAEESSLKNGIWGSGVNFSMGFTQFQTKQINQALSSVGIQGHLPFIHFHAGTEIVGHLGKIYVTAGSGGIWALTSTGSDVSSQGFLWSLGSGYLFLIKEKFGVGAEVRWQLYSMVLSIHNPPANVPNTFTSTLLTTNNKANFDLMSQSVFLGLHLALWGPNQPLWGFKLGATMPYNTKFKYSGQNITNAPSYMPFGFIWSVYFMI